MQLFVLLTDLIPLDEWRSSEEFSCEKLVARADAKSNNHEDTQGKSRPLVEEESDAVGEASPLDVELSFLGGRKKESILERLPLWPDESAA